MPRKIKHPKWIKRTKRLRYKSSKKADLDKAYAKARKSFLIDHPWCEWGLRQTPPQRIRATEIHHTRGRAGRLYLNEKFWLALSAKGHDWVHNNMQAAREDGLLCQRGEWGKQV